MATIEKTVVCLKWGNHPHTAEWVNRLYRGVARHLSPPFRFVCFTDEPTGMEPAIESRNIQSLTLGSELSGIWWKLAVMHPDAKLSGRCLFLDLDTVIVDNMDDFFSYPRRFYIIRNWIERRKQIFRARPQVGNSSVFRFETGTNSHVANLFLQNPAHANNRLIFPTEQAFITHAIEKNNITWRPESWVRSFKRHCLPIFPLNWLRRPQMEAGTKIIAFHGGTPKLDKVIKGTVGNWYKRTLPMPQLAKHWK
ncbi:glycosyl transferase [Candidatus Persebacteraceae bacterium Df01]|jgi:hypothetical protein|uniref:Glycosyl transferase n=1 Tax=Candidatus Doriopsillibacter californiensis TaxID=2970740 RepID=A0ABT7QMG3_9GAMM|nr:glycosyl transferase [Candidatus Persebacteraceae bacterium Df01]